MQGYLWIIWVKLAGSLWIIGGKLGSSLIFYFVAIDDRRSTIREKCKPKPILVWGTGTPESNKKAIISIFWKCHLHRMHFTNLLLPVHSSCGKAVGGHAY